MRVQQFPQESQVGKRVRETLKAHHLLQTKHIIGVQQQIRVAHGLQEDQRSHKYPGIHCMDGCVEQFQNKVVFLCKIHNHRKNY